MPVGVLDLAGNNYGGTSYNQSGVGDVVSDAQSIRGTVLKMSNQGGTWVVNVYTSNSADGQGHESYAQANLVTIVSHADGTGLVSGGAVTPTPTLTPPSALKFFQKSY
jgi:hypothetical protein